MKIKELDFMGVLLGSDINTYSMARAFHEAFEIKTIVVGKYYTGPSYESKIVDFYARPDLDNKEVFIETLNKIASEYQNKKLILLGCGDNYVRLIIENKNNLKDNFIIPYIDKELMENLIKKERFYEMCEKYNLAYPKTMIYDRSMGHDFILPFGFPMILKPSNSVDYFAHEFPGQYKVYKINNKEELHKTLDDIYESGYSDTLILQDFIPGDDSYMHVMTCYSNQEGKVQLMSLGNTMLEEHTPHGIGNHAAILCEYNEELSLAIKNFLESIHYIGFSNFDIKFDERDNTYKVFEINLRQGRSNYYVTGSGDNLAEYLVNDYIYHKNMPFNIANHEHLWTMLPLEIVYNYVNPKYLDKIKELVNRKAYVNPLYYIGDDEEARIARLKEADQKQFSKYETFLEK